MSRLKLKSMKRERSQALFEKIATVVPAGIDGNAKGFPHDVMPVAVRADGCRIYDADGNSYIDYCSGYGPLIFGHCDPDIVEAVVRQMREGDLFGLPHPLMYEAASRVVQHVPCADMVRFTNSGTEATLSAIRIARAYTGKTMILKFYGTYHGTHEFVLHSTKRVKPFPQFPAAEPITAGIPQSVIDDVAVLPFNDLALAQEFIRAHADELAAVIVEPVMGSYGIVADREFLQGLRDATRETGAVYIFDEVITGFRLALGGAQEVFDVEPDLVTLGKALGGGVPVGAFAGRREFMKLVIPSGDSERDAKERVYHSGTYNSNPVVLAAVVASLDKLAAGGVYEAIDRGGEQLRDGLSNLMKQYGVPGTTTGMGSIVQWYFGFEGPVRSLEDTFSADHALTARFHRSLLERGVFFIASPRGFVGAAHLEADISETLEAMEAAFEEL